MKKLLKNAAALLAATGIMFVALTGCNRGIVDLNQNFDYAYIYMGDDLVVEGKVEKWWNYEESDMVQVKIDGRIYLTHSANVLLVVK